MSTEEANALIVASPLDGEAVSLSSVADPAFSEKIMGEGIAIVPSGGKLCSPVDGTVDTIFETLHSIGLKTDMGADVLIHIGRDTVELKGKYFKAHVKEGERVKRGDLLISFDAGRIKKAGYDITTPMTIVNTADFEAVLPVAPGPVRIGAPVIEIRAKTS